MKKSVIWLVGGIVLIALIVGGYFYFKASADVVSSTNAGSNDVTMKMDTTYGFQTSAPQDYADISITNNSNSAISYLKVYIPASYPSNSSGIVADFKATNFTLTTKKTTMPVLGLNGRSVSTDNGAGIAAATINMPSGVDTNGDIAYHGYSIDSSGILTSNTYKVFPVIGSKLNSKTGTESKIQSLPPKTTVVLRVFFNKNFSSSPVTVTVVPKIPDPSTPREGLLIINITKTQAVTEKTMKLYIPKKIGVATDTDLNRYVILNYNNQQDIVVPVKNQSDLNGFEYDATTNGYSTIISKTGNVDVPHSLNEYIGDFVTFPIYPVLTVPALANGEKYSIPIDYTKKINECPYVAVYTAVNYDTAGTGGAAGCYPVGSWSTAYLVEVGLGDNLISAVTVAPGYKVILYKDDNFAGESLELTTDVADLSTKNFNDTTSSFKVIKL